MITTDYGVPVDFAIACANIDEGGLRRCVSGISISYCSMGYISKALAAFLFERYRTRLFPVRRRTQQVEYSKKFSKWLMRVRLRIETTIGQLRDQFSIGRIRVRDHLGV